MKITKKTRGFISDLSNDEYHDDRLFKSSTVLKTALNDPYKYYKVYVKGEESPKFTQDALNFGNYVHTAVLEPHLLDDEYVVYPSRRQGDQWKLFEHQNKDKVIITQNQFLKAQDLIDSFLQTQFEDEDGHKMFGDAIFKGGTAEESLFTELEGLPIKVRFDYRKPPENGKGIIMDIKTTSSYANSPRDAKEICENFGYFLSSALYVDAVEKETGVPHDFYLVFMSKSDLKANMYRVSNKSLARGREQYKEAIRLIKEWDEHGNYVKGNIREV